MVERVWLQTPAYARLDLQALTVKKISTSAQKESLSVTTIRAALTSQGGTTVSAGAVSMTTGLTHFPGIRVLTLMNVPYGPTRAGTIQLA